MMRGHTVLNSQSRTILVIGDITTSSESCIFGFSDLGVLNSRIHIIRTPPKKGTPYFRKPPFGSVELWIWELAGSGFQHGTKY